MHSIRCVSLENRRLNNGKSASLFALSADMATERLAGGSKEKLFISLSHKATSSGRRKHQRISQGCWYLSSMHAATSFRMQRRALHRHVCAPVASPYIHALGFCGCDIRIDGPQGRFFLLVFWQNFPFATLSVAFLTSRQPYKDRWRINQSKLSAQLLGKWTQHQLCVIIIQSSAKWTEKKVLTKLARKRTKVKTKSEVNWRWTVL